MAVAVVQDWVEEETERSTTNYDAVNERLAEQEDPPAGFIMHSAGFTGKGFRIYEVWETREQFEAFLHGRVLPLVAEVGGANAPPPQITIYELHNLILASDAPR